ncbi:hypothetical protein HPB48_004593 [Haemaphysalis longicornis]|uniref:NWD1/2-like winged helix-turn-helix domain-containing protein n=1 Tax=Haemaphysalis longicornis TaxID=44386 RepID=A0A9J6FGH5_HAELO|nr:hypothetical protein HPB48_004593 [Haemaphysalis longicornis]
MRVQDQQRMLTRQQWDVLRQRLAGQTASPLYVTLLSQQAMRWASYEALDGELHVPADTGAFVSRSLERIERQFGRAPVKKIASYLTCTSYGLREPEVIELLSSTECDGTELAAVSWLAFKKELGVLLKESYVDCRSYLQWSHRCIASCVRQRYLSERAEAVACHADLANAFHLGFLMQKEEKVHATACVEGKESPNRALVNRSAGCGPTLRERNNGEPGVPKRPVSRRIPQYYQYTTRYLNTHV